MKTGLILKLDDLINWCNSRVFSPDEVFGNHTGRRAGPFHPYRIDARSSVRFSPPAAAAFACPALPECAAGCHTPLPFLPACHSSRALPDLVPRCKFLPPVRPGSPQPGCCGIPCPPPLLPLHQHAPHICLPAVPPSPVPPPPRPLQSPSLSQSPCRRRLHHAS